MAKFAIYFFYRKKDFRVVYFWMYGTIYIKNDKI